jgi:hypothetical protein
MHQLRKVRTHINNRLGDDSSWPFLAAGFLSQACPGAAPLFHSCAMLVSLHKSKRQQRSSRGQA